MADPFTIVTGVASVLDICTRLVHYIIELKRDGATVQQELDSLMIEIAGLEKVHNAIDAACKKHAPAPTAPTRPRDNGTSPSNDTGSVWEHLERTVQNCHTILQETYSILADICKSKHTIKRVHALRSHANVLQQRRLQLVMYHDVIQMYLILLNGENTQLSFETVLNRLESIQSCISTGSGHNKEALRELKRSIINEHFHTPQTVSSIFTGRDELLRQLRDTFIQQPGSQNSLSQRRFVVHGMGGSGKTQFCCKFAEDNRHSFWGVFFVDGSSVQNIQKSLGNIARLAGKDPNANAALEWLSTAKQRWLLLFDNADDPDINIESYFPRGESGHILITTRNQFFKVLGSVEPKFFNFRGLKSDEASDLLLKATCLPVPWQPDLKGSASKVIDALGYLALAIVQAGAAIRKRLCSLHDYLEWYDRSWKKLRDGNVKASTKNEQAIWTTFELCYERLEQSEDQEAADAIELLQLFSFLYRENLSPSILTRAIRNARLEADQGERDAAEESLNPFRRQPSLREVIQNRFTSILMVIIGLTPTPLPSLIRDGQRLGGFELAKDRISGALSELENMSLIYYNEGRDTYTMHPVVHEWARKRPRMKLRHQAIWADMAGYVLSASILLQTTAPEDELYNSSLLPHIEHVQQRRAEIRAQLDLRRPWFRLPSLVKVTEYETRMFAKFSLVYAQCWQLQSAEALLKEVVAILVSSLGHENKKTRTAQLALSNIYWELGKLEEALRLQRSISATCERYFGRRHPETLRALHKLSRSLWQQGKFSEAMRLQTEAVDGLTELLGRRHKDTLEAIDDLGRTVAKFWRKTDLQRAYGLFSEALDGMVGAFGADHLRTTYVKENIARISCLIGGANRLKRALQLMDEVIATRKEKMGKEAGWTLLALGNKAVVLGALGRLPEAEDLMRHVLPIATRNNLADHIGVLFGRQVLASIVIQRGRHDDAEQILREVTEKQRAMSSRRGDYHPDRIGSLCELARCYQLQGKLDESIAVCGETIQGLEAISERRHLFTEIMMEARAQMVEQRERLRRTGDAPDADAADYPVVKFPEHLFKLY
ncbi:tetratricopeptide repeat domain-containing protein [Xylaria palmicola]|nr:tetratricopeptide repeat domain-containing protein [Xylaria palmicola]